MHKEKCKQIDFPVLSANRLICAIKKSIMIFLISFIVLFALSIISPGKGEYCTSLIVRFEQSLQLTIGLSLYIVIIKYVNLNSTNGLYGICKKKQDFPFFSKIRTECSIKFAILAILGLFIAFVTLDVFVLSDAFVVFRNAFIFFFLMYYFQINCINNPNCKFHGEGV